MGALSVVGIRSAANYSGEWVGHFMQQPSSSIESKPKKYHVNITLTQFLAVLTGTLEYTDEKGDVRLDINGRANSDRTITLDYRNDNNNVVQHGTIVLSLDPRAQQLTGGFAGFGPLTKDMIFGSVFANRSK